MGVIAFMYELPENTLTETPVEGFDVIVRLAVGPPCGVIAVALFE
jgi:hypothetical protein